jgi:hypothetical protein
MRGVVRDAGGMNGNQLNEGLRRAAERARQAAYAPR